MIRVGIVGEDPNDTVSIAALLKKNFNAGVHYFPLLKRVRGYQLDNAHTKKALEIECNNKQPDIILFIRDTDGIITETDKTEEKQKWYRNISRHINCKKILLLNIYELEALIVADIESFNTLYNIKIKFTGDVTYLKDPKEFLKTKTFKNRKRYSESDCPTIFEKLNYETVVKNCKFFNDFTKKYSKILEE